MKGQCQKVETLGDGSVKSSVYFLREDKSKVMNLDHEEVEVMLAADFKALSSGDNWVMPHAMREALRDAVRRILDLLADETPAVEKTTIEGGSE